MGDVGDYWREANAYKKQAKAKRWKENEIALRKKCAANQIPLEIANYGTGHAIVDGSIDFWLSTGTWMVRGQKRRGHGIRQLLHYIASDKLLQEKIENEK